MTASARDGVKVPPAEGGADPFPGAGEMAGRCRSFDWNSTPLGPASAWPQSLRTALDATLGSAFASVLLWGPELVVAAYSDAYIPLIGIAHPRVLGLPVFAAWPEIREVNSPLFARVLAGETVSLFDAPYQLYRHGADRPPEVCYFTASMCPLRDESAAVRGILSTLFETTDAMRTRGLEADRERLLGAERDARSEAEAANRAKGDFLAVMSHELRTPLNAIGGYTELLELGIHGPVNPEQAKALARIQQSQRHLLGLINGVLSYSRVGAGAVHYAVEDVPLDEVLVACEALTAPQMRARRLDFRHQGCDRRLVARADREKVQQIVLNLLSNAVKFTEPSGAITVDCGLRPDGAVAVRVTDTGHGIAADQLERIFQPFVQVDSKLTRTHEGTGLGLAISRDLARGMGGDLTVESTVDAGSTFTLTLRGPEAATP